MSQTSIRLGTSTSLGKRTVTRITEKAPSNRRYSDFNIVFLEGQKKVDFEN